MLLCPSSSSVAIVDLNRPSTTLSLTSAVNVTLNDVFNCSIPYTYPTATPQWSLDGVLLPVQTQTYTANITGSHNLTCTPQIAGTALCASVSTAVSVFVIDCPTAGTITRVSSSTATFSCSAHTVATVSYSWTDSVTTPTTSSVSGTGQTYTVPSTTPGYHLLTCTAAVTSNPTCSPVSTTFNVTIISCPQNVAITQQPLGQWISGVTSFNCSSTNGFPSVAYAWYNATTFLANGFTITLTSPGYYLLTCVATASNGIDSCSTNTTVSNLLADCPPTATITSVSSSTAKTLSCSAQSVATVSYSWTDSVTTPTTSSVTGTGQTYTVPSTTPGYHLLTCTASIPSPPGTCPPAVNTFNVTVIGCPQNVAITTQPVGPWIAGTTTFNCSSTNGFPSVTYKWYNDTTFLTNGFNYTLATSGKYLLTCVATASDGVDSCSANNSITNSAANCPTTATITSLSSSTPKTFSCSAQSAATVLYSWTDSVTIPAVSSVSGTGSSYTVPSTPGYHVLNCTATIAAPPGTCTPASTTFNVTVIGCPQNVAISQLPAGPWVAGQTTFNCSSTNAFPAVTYSWYNGTTFLANGFSFNLTNSGNYALTCVATASDGVNSCPSNTTITNVASACPQNVTIRVNSSALYTVGDQITCSSTGGFPSTTYRWSPGSASGSTLTLSSSGPLVLMCTAIVPGCQSTATVNITVQALTTTTQPATTAAPVYSWNLGTLIAAIVVPSSLALLALLLLACYCCFAAGLTPDRSRTRDAALQLAEIPPDDAKNVQPPAAPEEASFYAPGYAFNGASYAAGYGRF